MRGRPYIFPGARARARTRAVRHAQTHQRECVRVRADPPLPRDYRLDSPPPFPSPPLPSHAFARSARLQRKDWFCSVGGIELPCLLPLSVRRRTVAFSASLSLPHCLVLSSPDRKICRGITPLLLSSPLKRALYVPKQVKRGPRPLTDRACRQDRGEERDTEGVEGWGRQRAIQSERGRERGR